MIAYQPFFGFGGGVFFFWGGWVGVMMARLKSFVSGSNICTMH